MREIEFRGVILNNDDRDFFGTWWYGDLIHFANGGVGIRQVETGKTLEVIPETVGQFTGITDMYTQKIFEGDILSDHGMIIISKFSNGSFNFVTRREKLIVSPVDTTQYEVIGNIHDNHELIK
jgi:hypothetical protein